jgi:PIN domain nuclease of toxin-antitoxin system
MDLLLDTHAAVWWAAGDPDLSTDAATAVNDPENTVWFSAASAWELSIKTRSRRLELDVSNLVDQLTRNGIRLLGIGIDDAITAGSLDWTHKDPFDRMLVAQASRLGYRIVTRDVAIQKYLNSPNGAFVNA